MLFSRKSKPKSLNLRLRDIEKLDVASSMSIEGKDAAQDYTSLMILRDAVTQQRTQFIEFVYKAKQLEFLNYVASGAYCQEQEAKALHLLREIKQRHADAIPHDHDPAQASADCVACKLNDIIPG